MCILKVYKFLPVVVFISKRYIFLSSNQQRLIFVIVVNVSFLNGYHKVVSGLRCPPFRSLLALLLVPLLVLKHATVYTTEAAWLASLKQSPANSQQGP